MKEVPPLRSSSFEGVDISHMHIMERYHGEKQVVGKQLLTLRSRCMNLVFWGIGVPPCHGCLHNPSYPNFTLEPIPSTGHFQEAFSETNMVLVEK